MTIDITIEKEKIKDGINRVVKAIASTMGAKGKQVAISTTDGSLRFTSDGVTVAKSIKLSDPIEDIGAQLVINSANKTVEECGDGTSSTSVLLGALTNLEIPPSQIERVVEIICDKVTQSSTKVTKVSQIKDITSISSKSEYIGNLISEIYEKIGFDSIVNLEIDEDAYKTYYNITPGVEFSSGYLSRVFGNQKNGNCIFENCNIIIDTDKHSNLDNYGKVFSESIKSKIPVVVISPDFSDSVKELAVRNLKQNLQVCLVKSPGFGKQVNENYKDIQSLSNEEGIVSKVTITPTTISIIPHVNNTINKRIEEVKNLLDGYLEDYDKVKIPQRIHSLQRSTATIYVGGVTIKSINELYDRIEDAIGASKAAIRSGIVKGAGFALYEAAKGTILESLCSTPMKTIKKNANLPTDTVERDVITGLEVNLLEKGIIDPTDVITQSLRNAFASYKLYYDTEYIIHNEAQSPFKMAR